MKNCLFCTKFYYSTGMSSYGEMTPGCDVSIGCGANLWDLDNQMDTEDDFRRKMTSAETCADYDPRPLVDPFEYDLTKETIRVLGSQRENARKNKRYRTKPKVGYLAKKHGKDRDSVDRLLAMCILAAGLLAPSEWENAIRQTISDHKNKEVKK